MLAGAGLRAAGALDQFWLDEIWSLRMVRTLGSPVGILTRLTHDNNHPLNSLFLWLVGPTPNWVLYRGLAVASSIAALLLVVRLTRERPVFEALAAVALTALSYPLVVYGSEARGYAPAMLCALAALSLFEKARLRGQGGALASFWFALVAGLLAHLTFAFAFAALVLLAVDRSRRRASPAAVGAGLARLFLPPLLVSGALYYPYLRGLGFGDAPPEPLPAVLRQWMALVAGAPNEGLPGTVAALIAAALLAIGAAWAWRDGDRDRAFLLGILLLPPLSAAVLRPPFLVVRYFVVSVPFLILLVARTLERLRTRDPRGRWLSLAVLASFLVGSAAHVSVFLRVGRGHYREAVDHMLESTPGEEVSVTSDHDFRNRMMLSFYVPYGKRPKRIVYTPLAAVPPEGTEWLIRHSLEREPRPPAETRVGATTYRLEYRAPFFGELSGFHWFLYRRVGARSQSGSVFDDAGSVDPGAGPTATAR